MAEFAIAIGSNRGDRRASLVGAGEMLVADGVVHLRKRSTLVESAAVGGPAGQGAFLNGAWVVETDLGPHQLLHRLQAIEHAFGRVRTIPWGPRTLDLDLVLARDGRMVHSAVLDLPHPRFHERLFVLEPLAEIAGDWVHPELKFTIHALLTHLCKQGGSSGSAAHPL